MVVGSGGQAAPGLRRFELQDELHEEVWVATPSSVSQDGAKPNSGNVLFPGDTIPMARSCSGTSLVCLAGRAFARAFEPFRVGKPS